MSPPDVTIRTGRMTHLVECDIVMTDTSSSQQGGMRGIASPPAKMLVDASYIPTPSTPLGLGNYGNPKFPISYT